MSVDTTLITAAEFVDMTTEFDGLCELVQGEVREMTRPTVRHGSVCASIVGEIWSWARRTRYGRVVSNDAGILTTRNPDTVRGPDLYYISESRLPAGESPRQWLEIPPDLCVEVLSPSDRWNDVLEKVTEYLEFGVPEVWVADADLRRLHVFRTDCAPVILEGDAVVESQQLPDFRAGVTSFFEDC